MSVMGATKRLAELYCQALDLATVGHMERKGPVGPRTRFMTVRFGNVLGSSGSVVPLFQQQLAQGRPLTVTHRDIKRYFMTIQEASELVLQASAYGLREDTERGTVFVLDMGEPIRIVDIARQMIRLAGKQPEKDVGIYYTGLRPGEKLYEELFDRDETQLPIAAPGVLAVRSRPVELATLGRAISELAEACSRQNEAALRTILARVVPGYKVAEITQPNAA
jgi:FlaA1/EpsC-like NDP-sugar epimerase